MRILADVRSAANGAAWYGACAREVVADRASDTELDRDDYQRLAVAHAEVGAELMEEAERMVRQASKRQLAAWLAHPDTRVRLFVLERLSVRV